MHTYCSHERFCWGRGKTDAWGFGHYFRIFSRMDVLAEETANINNIQKLCVNGRMWEHNTAAVIRICVARGFVFKKQFNYLL